jgi:hypothetical protein
MDQWLSSVDEWTLWLIVLVGLQGAAALGYRLARHHADSEGDGRAEISATQGTVLGLLALLLGFTFAMAGQRFEERKTLVRDEANGIGTLGLRIQLLPAERRARVTQLLLRYTDTRFSLQREGFDPARLHEHHARAGQLQDQLWAEAMAVAAVAPDSETVSLFISALNDVIDLHGMQMAAIRNRIPSAIFVLLFVVALAALGLAGYGSRLPSRQRFALTFLLSFLFSSVMILTVDLHRPARGLVVVSLKSLEDARDSLRLAAEMDEPRRPL